MSEVLIHRDNCRASSSMIGRRLSGLIRTALAQGGSTKQVDDFFEIFMRLLFTMSSHFEVTAKGRVHDF